MRNILADLLEFECKLASLLMLKQREWGIDKELLQIMQLKIKTIVQDARYMCCNGSTIKAIQKQYSVLSLTAKEQVREEGVVHMLKLDNEAGLVEGFFTRMSNFSLYFLKHVFTLQFIHSYLVEPSLQ